MNLVNSFDSSRDSRYKGDQGNVGMGKDNESEKYAAACVYLNDHSSFRPVALIRLKVGA